MSEVSAVAIPFTFQVYCGALPPNKGDAVNEIGDPAHTVSAFIEETIETVGV